MKKIKISIKFINKYIFRYKNENKEPYLRQAKLDIRFCPLL